MYRISILIRRQVVNQVSDMHERLSFYEDADYCCCPLVVDHKGGTMVKLKRRFASVVFESVLEIHRASYTDLKIIR